KTISMIRKLIAGAFFLLTIPVTLNSQLSLGLKAYYSFQGNVSDHSGNGNDGVLVGNPILTQDRFGISECAYYFPGTSNDYIQVNYSADFDIDSLGAFSISLWYQGGTVSEGDYEILFEKPNDDVSPYPSDYSLALYDLNKPGLGSNYRPIVSAFFDPPIPDTSWHHVVGIYDNRNWYFFEDNSFVDMDTSQEYVIFQSSNNIIIGKNFEGVIDDIRFYNRALNPFDIYEIFHLQSSCIPTPPQPICRTLISAIPYETDSLIIPARYFDNGSYDQETPHELLRFSYSTDPADSIRVVTCATAQSFVVFDVYVFAAEGTYDYCSVAIEFSDQYCGVQSQSMTDNESPVIFIEEKILPTHPDPNIRFCLRPQDFVLYGYDNSDPNNTMIDYSFSSNFDDTVRCYSCMDEGYYLLDIYAIDTAGNQIHVPTSILIRANAGCFIDLLDTIPQVSICISDTVLNVDTTGQITIFPNSLNAGSYDDKTEEQNLQYSFSENDSDSLIFTCDDLGEHIFSIIVTDEVGNTSECTSNLVISDSANYCETSSSDNISSFSMFSIYPNPGEGFYIRRNAGNSSEAYSVKVIDAMGRLVYESGVLYTGEYIVTNLTAGMYSVLIMPKSASPCYLKWICTTK
ncbi:MAG: LamG-like jellyroll fold domain-containing protein, partial [Saprospiraceae bacterium]